MMDGVQWRRSNGLMKRAEDDASRLQEEKEEVQVRVERVGSTWCASNFNYELHTKKKKNGDLDKQFEWNKGFAVYDMAIRSVKEQKIERGESGKTRQDQGRDKRVFSDSTNGICQGCDFLKPEMLKGMYAAESRKEVRDEDSEGGADRISNMDECDKRSKRKLPFTERIDDSSRGRGQLTKEAKTPYDENEHSRGIPTRRKSKAAGITRI
ncbi:hypothetical protein R3P38DRAFT_3507118 [Favolaschia claudopus]|uniref:Uncharacterized protein n=1 Tax=Favolaschia claudopus TaxID=2862362 RepID=A0AAW0BZ10_9AGAR